MKQSKSVISYRVSCKGKDGRELTKGKWRCIGVWMKRWINRNREDDLDD